MGLDLVDTLYRLERRYGVRLRADDFKPYFAKPAHQLTAGELHSVLCDALARERKPVPVSSWNGVRRELAEVAVVSPFVIRRQSRLRDDLGIE